MANVVIGFQEIDRSQLMEVGGKGANLGELAKLEELLVPDGFCVTTEAYRMLTESNEELNRLLDELANNHSAISQTSAEIRQLIENLPIPQAVVVAIEAYLSKLGKNNAYAVRSSATAEDLPTASFAGQQDTYLNVIGIDAIRRHIGKCWASLFTERAVVYRQQHHFDHRKVQLAVVVQLMVFPEVAGILFTADPVSGHRKVTAIDASFGLGEALVSGMVSADSYKVREGKIIDKKIGEKKLAVYASKNGGTVTQAIKGKQQQEQVLTNTQILELAQLGRKIEKHFGHPQDIEWCLADGCFYMVQSRPVTTLFPIPKASDNENHVYVSVGHNQMMTDAMKPLGISFFDNSHMHEAGGRLFVDITRQLSAPESRKKLIETFGQSDVLIRDAVASIASRKGFIKPSPDAKLPQAGYVEKNLPWSYLANFERDTTLVAELMGEAEASLAVLKQNIQKKSGTALFDFIREDLAILKQIRSNPKGWEVIKVGFYASAWLNKRLLKWLGEKSVADVLSQGVANNVTSEMGLALLDVADAIRPYPVIIEYLRTAADNFLAELVQFEGGLKAKAAIEAFLDKYGMRCVGEIDITKTRWSEKPLILVPMILSNLRNFGPGAGSQRFEQGQKEALKKEQDLLEKLLQLPNGKRKARETKRMISLLRSLIGYREYPKYGMICRYGVYKQAMMKEAEKLVQAKVIKEKEDVYYFTIDEFRAVVGSHRIDRELLAKRKEEYRLYEKLSPPRVMTSAGEIIKSSYKRKYAPEGSLLGLPVSSGTIEGRARVILSMEEADLQEGDILVTAFTDPSWTPLFVAIKGLVTEVGGLMTHGAVIAREYGLPAVVGLEDATQLIKDGQRIRVNGTEGFVEILG